MIRFALPLVVAALLSLPRLAGAAPLTELEKGPFVVTTEAGDAWLHDHCSFRGTGGPSLRDARIDGQVVELVVNGDTPLVKDFRCAEQPPGWKAAFTPASDDEVACRLPKSTSICAPPLHPPAPPPPPPPPPPHASATVAPPAMIAPPHKPPPKRTPKRSRLASR